MRSKIVLYMGSRGKGKTLTMVKDAYRYYLDGYKVLANIDLPFAKYISNEDVLLLDKDSRVRNCVLLLDEIQVFYDSRASSNKVNMRFSNFIQQIRKRGVIVLCTTQFANAVDKRLRQHLDIIALPEFDSVTLYCLVTYVDITTVENDLFGQAEPLFTSSCFDARPIFSMYSTYEVIR